MSHLPLMTAGVALAALSALLSGIETALFSLKSFQIQRLHQHNPSLARTLAALMENPRRTLSAILLADVMANVPLILVALYAIREVWHFAAPFWVVALTLFTLIVFFCDLVPKLIALAQPYFVARIGAAFLHLAMRALDPVSRVLQRTSEALANALTPAKFRPNLVLSPDELETLIELSAEDGAIEATERELIHEIIKLGDRTVKDCMTPRIEVFGISDDLTNDAVIAEIRAKRHRRIPIFGDTPDDILGILDAKNFLFDPTQHYTEMMIPPSFVPATMKALDLLGNFLRHPQGMAVIVDEFGGTEGIITLADIIEEIIGDAAPSSEETVSLESVGEGRFIVSGQTRLDDLSERVGSEIEADGVDTVGGLIFNRLGYLPKQGTEVRLNQDLLATVRRVSRKRIEEILVTRSSGETKS